MEARHAIEAAQHLRDVGAEDAAVGVELVDDHERQPLEESSPGRVVGEDARVQHVGRGDQHVRRVVAQLLSRGGGCVAVVDRRANARAGQSERAGVFLEALALILLERFQREQIEGARLGVCERAPQHRQVVDERLAARGRGCEHHVATVRHRRVRRRVGFEQVDRARLVAVELRDLARGEHGREPFRTRGQAGCVGRRLCGERLVVTQRGSQRVLVANRSQERGDVGHANLRAFP